MCGHAVKLNMRCGIVRLVSCRLCISGNDRTETIIHPYGARFPFNAFQQPNEAPIVQFGGSLCGMQYLVRIWVDSSVYGSFCPKIDAVYVAASTCGHILPILAVTSADMRALYVTALYLFLILHPCMINAVCIMCGAVCFMTACWTVYLCRVRTICRPGSGGGCVSVPARNLCHCYHWRSTEVVGSVSVCVSV